MPTSLSTLLFLFLVLLMPTRPFPGSPSGSSMCMCLAEEASLYCVKPTTPSNATTYPVDDKCKCDSISNSTNATATVCHTLNDYAEKNFTFNQSVTFLFLEGTHELNRSSFNVQCCRNLSFQAMQEGIARIVLNDNKIFEFESVQNVSIENLTFFGSEKCQKSITFRNVTDLSFIGIRMHDGDMYTNDLSGRFEMVKSIFLSSSIFFEQNPGPITTPVPYSNLQDYHFNAESNVTTIPDMAVNINSCVFKNAASSPAVKINVTASPMNACVNINNCTFSNLSHTALRVIVVSGSSFEVAVFNSTFEDIHFTCNSDHQLLHCASAVEIIVKDYTSFDNHCPHPNKDVNTEVQFAHSVFRNNTSINPTGMGATLLLTGSKSTHFTNCSFHNNFGTALLAVNSTFHISGNGDTRFVGNKAAGGGAMAFYGESLMIIDNTTQILFENNVAKAGGAIFVEKGLSDVTMFSQVSCFFFYNSTEPPAPTNITLTFTNNTSKFGGNILFGGELDRCYYKHTSNNWCDQQRTRPVACFKQLSNLNNKQPENLTDITSFPSRVCLTMCNEGNITGMQWDCVHNINNIFTREISLYPGQMLTLNAMLVGDTLGTVFGTVYAALLPGSGQINMPEDKFTLLPGQKTQVVNSTQSCTRLDYNIFSNGSKKLVILVLTSSPTQSFIANSVIGRKAVNKMIENLWYVNNTIIFNHLSLQLASIPLYQSITLTECPLGLDFSKEKMSCVCNPILTDRFNTHCNVSKHTFSRSDTTWLNASNPDRFEISHSCPYYYCNTTSISVGVKPSDTKEQCNYHRTGRLCGKCMHNYTRAIGGLGYGCVHNSRCSHYHLFLLLFFAFAGMVLPGFIKLLNLTVSMGTINGLLFYANIVGTAPSIFFSYQNNYNILKVFIAWINLDFGIESCFYSGLDSYSNIWLEMLFPIYLFFIVGVTIFLSRYSTRLTRLLGTNCTDVLATLMLVSYTKLLHVVTHALWFSTIVIITKVADVDQNNNNAYTASLDDRSNTFPTYVWRLDGSVDYLGRKHIPLFLAALAVLLILWLPFTMILLFWQLLQKLSHYRIVHWIVVKKMPFFENYFSPLKGQHRYWIGVLLVCRSILLLVSVSVNDVKAYLLAITTVVVILLVYLANLPSPSRSENMKKYAYFSGCYRNWYLSVLESSFFLNLGILSIGTLYLWSTSHYNFHTSTPYLSYISVGIVFMQFIGIIVYHSYFSIRKYSNLSQGVNGGSLRVSNGGQRPAVDDAAIYGGRGFEDVSTSSSIQQPPAAAVAQGVYMYDSWNDSNSRQYRDSILSQYDSHSSSD